MEKILEYLVSRMQEPSTWVSLGVLATGIGWNIAPDYWQAIAGIGMGLGGLLGTILREHKKTSAVEIKNVVEAVVKPQAMEPQALSAPQLNDAMKKPS